ncbi:MAG: response regulator, partial [Chloroflexi bacterium]|nr:response regulator [Chloroflexota bacterium]
MTGARILVVDDEPALVRLCAELLVEAGYQAQPAYGGRQALDRLEQERFDLLLLDLKMPGVDGLTVLRRAAELYPGVTAVIMTSHGSRKNAIDALRVGARDFLLKPFDSDELLEAVGKALATHRREQAVLEDRAVRQQFAGILERISDGLAGCRREWMTPHLVTTEYR